MSTNPESSPAPQSWLDRLAANRQVLGVGLVAVAIGFLVLSIWAGVRAYRATAPATPQSPLGLTGVPADFAALALWAGFVGVVVLFTSPYLAAAKPEPGTEANTVRLALLVDGCLAGWATILLAAVLAYAWAGIVFGGWTRWRSPQAWQLWVVIFGVLGGMMVSFASLQLARVDEHSNPFWRKVLYGTSAAFCCALLVGILLLVNLLTYVPWGPLAYLGKEYAWSVESTYRLGSRSENVLDALTDEKPARIYVILPTNDAYYFPLVALVDNMKAVVNDTERLQVEFLSPDRDRDRVEKLQEEFKFDDRRGVLLLYGKGAARDSRFIKYTDFQDPRMEGFKGEHAIISELSLLQAGKTRPTIYFTQGNGELDLNDGVMDIRRLNEGAGVLKRRLEEYHYKVKGLELAELPGTSRDPNLVIAPRVPDDAGIVVIAGPRRPWSQYALRALDEYMTQRQGRLIVFLDRVLTLDRKMVETGLERYLQKYNVLVGNDRVLSYVTRGDPEIAPAQVPHVPNPRENGFIAALGTMFRNQQIPLYEVRTVQPAPQPIGGPDFIPEILLEVNTPNSWVDVNVGTNPLKLMDAAEVAKHRAERSGPIPVAVIVSERPKGGKREAQSEPAKPRLAAFGDATLISNGFMSRRGWDEISLGLFINILAWLRERPQDFGIEAHKNDVFMLRRPIGFDTLILPGLLVFVSIIGLGAGVWVVRRR